MNDHDFQQYLSEFLTRFLPGEVGSATNTIRSYRDTFSLLLRYCRACEEISPERMRCELLTKELVERFLTWLETERGCSPATRNQRLAAVRSFCRYLQVRDIDRIGQYQRVLAIPKKRAPAATPGHLTVDGVRLILAQPDTATSSGQRDLALLALMYDSGARVQEIVDLTVTDFRADPPAIVKLTGKGGKTRIVPLMPPTSTLLQRYMEGAGMTRAASGSRPLFPNRSGARMTRAGVAYTLAKHVTAAVRVDPAALPAHVSPHTLRHSKAMHLLQAGVDLVYIRDILGHADLKTTEIYARIDGEMKRRALEDAFTNVIPSHELPEWHQNKEVLTWLTSLG